MWRGIFNSLKEYTPAVSKQLWGYIAMWGPVVAVIAGVVGFILWAKSTTPPMPIWTIITIGGGILLFLVANIFTFKNMEDQRDEKQRQLKQVLEPKLEMFFGHCGSCEQTMQIEQGGVRRLFRVGIENKAGATVEGVQVKLESIEPSNSEFNQRLPAQLHRMHDSPSSNQPGDWEDRFDVHPRDKEYIDVVEKCEKQPRDSDEVMKFWLKPFGLYSVPCGHYTITLAAHAHNSVGCTGRFTIDVDEQGHLHFEQTSLS